MARDCGMCQPCALKGRVTAGNQVDHIVSKANAKRMGWTQAQIDADSNLQCICGPCHKTKTEQERGFTSRPTIGMDGWPVE